MNWDAVGAIGAVIGGVAVVVTLGFLAIQIRQSERTQREANAIARSAVIDKVFEEFSTLWLFLAADPEITRIWIAGCAGETLEEIEAERFRQLATTHLTMFGIWGERSSVFDPEMRDYSAAALQEQLDLHPGLRPVWNEVARQFEAAATHFG